MSLESKGIFATLLYKYLFSLRPYLKPLIPQNFSLFNANWTDQQNLCSCWKNEMQKMECLDQIMIHSRPKKGKTFSSLPYSKIGQ